MRQTSTNENRQNFNIVSDWSIKLTEQLLNNRHAPQQRTTAATDCSPSAVQRPTTYISPVSTEAMIIHSPDSTTSTDKKHDTFEEYIDREFTRDKAAILKNRLSEATTLRNSSAFATHQNQQQDLGDYYNTEQAYKRIEKGSVDAPNNEVIIMTTPPSDLDMPDKTTDYFAQTHPPLLSSSKNLDTKGSVPRHHLSKEQPPNPAIDGQSNNSSLDTSDHVWWISGKDAGDGFYSISGLLFLLGFLFPPFWWIGAIWPKDVSEKGGKMAGRWQKLNRIMSIGFSTIVLILVIVFAVLYATDTY